MPKWFLSGEQYLENVSFLLFGQKNKTKTNKTVHGADEMQAHFNTFCFICFRARIYLSRGLAFGTTFGAIGNESVTNNHIV